MIKTKLTVYFDEPFWAGVFERTDSGRLSACKITFGAEPTDAQIYAFILAHYNKLTFSPPVKAEEKHKADNPKRRQRNAGKQLTSSGIGTKSQQALQQQRELMKTERRQITKEMKEAQKQRLFELKQQKRKEKHRGH